MFIRINKRLARGKGFTLFEVLIVLVVFGLFLAVVLPRAMRAQAAAKYSEIRQHGSEIAGYIITWAEDMARNQPAGASYTLKDFLNDDINESDLGVRNVGLSGKYTGNEAFDKVARIMGSDQPPQNPFNRVSYFSKANDDTTVPTHKPGLLYLAALPDAKHNDYLGFYLLITSDIADKDGNYWYGDMNANDERIRRGVFVARLYNDQEPGGAEKMPIVVTPEKPGPKPSNP